MSERPTPGGAPEMTPSWHAAHRGDVAAVVMASSGATTTYAELDDRSRRLAALLHDRGIGPGGHVAVLMENNRAFLEVLWAAQRSGLHYTAINRHLRPGEVQYVLDDCGASALVSSEAMRDVVAELDLSRISTRICAAGALDSFERYDDLLASASPDRAVARAGGPRDALLLRHDGTTEGRAEGTAGHALR